MFTGIIETSGTLRSVRRERGGATLVIDAAFDSGALVLGESISVEGPCLTVERVLGAGFEAFASSETLDRTTLGRLRSGQKVNLERAMKADGRFGGHIVTGHVDAVGTVRQNKAFGDAREVTIEAGREVLAFLAEKGSVTVNGVSLTVNGVTGKGFTLMLIPHTLAGTALDGLSPGNPVNLEVDVLARYVHSFLGRSNLQERRPVSPHMLELIKRLDED